MSGHMCRNQAALSRLLRCYRQRRQQRQKVLTFSFWAEEGRYTIYADVNAHTMSIGGPGRTTVIYG